MVDTVPTHFGWRMPVDVRFGAGCAEAVPQELGERAAVVMAFEPATALGWRDRWTQALGSRLRDWVEVPDGLSSVARCRELSGRVWSALAERPDTVLIGLGGGTTLDVAKVLRCRPVATADRLVDQVLGGFKPTHPSGFEAVAAALRGQAPWPDLELAPLWMVPTTAGTGSEVTRWATVWDTDSTPAQKRSFDEPFGFAEKAFVDPLLALSCPTQVTRDTGLDALSHALEAIWNRHSNPFSDVLAVSAAQKVLKWLPVALGDPGDVAAREALSLASLQAGMAFSQTRTALAHALSYAVTLEQGVPHGLACALWLPAAWSLAQGRDPRVDALLGQVFDDAAPQTSGLTAVKRLQTWLSSVDAPCDPAAVGVLDAEQRIAAALGSARGRNFIAAGA
jgi:phosphonate metabolism-associated iron-containing alcohol dehydrogenase